MKISLFISIVAYVIINITFLVLHHFEYVSFTSHSEFKFFILIGPSIMIVLISLLKLIILKTNVSWKLCFRCFAILIILSVINLYFYGVVYDIALSF